MKLRKLLLWTHLVVGLVAALVLILLGTTGAVMIFETEIHYALNAKLYRLDFLATPLRVEELVSRVEKAQNAKVTSLQFPTEADIAPTVGLKKADGKSLSVTVNPFNGEVLGSIATANNFIQKLHQFHKNLLLGETGKLITGWGAWLLLVLALTGIVLWWPRKIFWFSGSKSGARKNFDLHNALGFYASVFMLIFGVTGIVIHWDDEAMKLVGSMTHSVATQPIPTMKPAAADARPLDAGRVWEIASKAVPGAQVCTMQGLGATRSPLRITMRFPEDRTPAGRTNVYIHPVTGEVLLAQTSRDAPAGYKIVKVWNRQIHTGDAWGWPSRIIACLASLALPLLVLTGFLIWWGRLRRKRPVAPDVAAPI
jgi:uncharacterized iron-regulated membrane protein